MEWTEELSLRLIECYRQNPMLWDPTNKDFKLSKKKIDLWKNIGEELKCGEGEAKRKIESLLTSYRREVRREGRVRSGMSTEDVYHSRWFAFKAMHFLNDKIRPRKTLNTENDGGLADETQDNDESHILNASQEREENEFENTSIQQHCPITPIPDLNKTTGTKSQPSASYKGTAKKRQQEDLRLEADNRAGKKEKNECALYGEYIVSQLEKFDEHTRVIVKHEIGNILFQAEMGRYKLQPTSPSQSIYYGGQYQNQQNFNDLITVSSPSTAPPSPSPSSAAIPHVTIEVNEVNTNVMNGPALRSNK